MRDYSFLGGSKQIMAKDQGLDSLQSFTVPGEFEEIVDGTEHQTE